MKTNLGEKTAQSRGTTAGLHLLSNPTLCLEGTFQSTQCVWSSPVHFTFWASHESALRESYVNVTWRDPSQ